MKFALDEEGRSGGRVTRKCKPGTGAPARRALQLPLKKMLSARNFCHLRAADAP
jgi:hypothetical protein